MTHYWCLLFSKPDVQLLMHPSPKCISREQRVQRPSRMSNIHTVTTSRLSLPHCSHSHSSEPSKRGSISALTLYSKNYLYISPICSWGLQGPRECYAGGSCGLRSTLHGHQLAHSHTNSSHGSFASAQEDQNSLHKALWANFSSTSQRIISTQPAKILCILLWHTRGIDLSHQSLASFAKGYSLLEYDDSKMPQLCSQLSAPALSAGLFLLLSIIAF